MVNEVPSREKDKLYEDPGHMRGSRSKKISQAQRNDVVRESEYAVEISFDPEALIVNARYLQYDQTIPKKFRAKRHAPAVPKFSLNEASSTENAMAFEKLRFTSEAVHIHSEGVYAYIFAHFKDVPRYQSHRISDPLRS